MEIKRSGPSADAGRNLKNIPASAEAKAANLNQNHNTKKVSLGPNTKR